jgi:hypothetical protein
MKWMVWLALLGSGCVERALPLPGADAPDPALPDLSTVQDASTRRDLSSGRDLSGRDLSTAPDLSSPPDLSSGPLLSAHYELPADGQPNQNHAIGPFCCTGVTATVRAPDGQAIGYIYFFGFDQGYQVGATAYAMQARILISGAVDLAQPSGQMQSEVDFQASEMAIGASRSASAGALSFAVTIAAVDLVDFSAQPYYDMGTFRVSVDVTWR